MRGQELRQGLDISKPMCLRRPGICNATAGTFWHLWRRKTKPSRLRGSPLRHKALPLQRKGEPLQEHLAERGAYCMRRRGFLLMGHGFLCRARERPNWLFSYGLVCFCKANIVERSNRILLHLRRGRKFAIGRARTGHVKVPSKLGTWRQLWLGSVFLRCACRCIPTVCSVHQYRAVPPPADWRRLACLQCNPRSNAPINRRCRRLPLRYCIVCESCKQADHLILPGTFFIQPKSSFSHALSFFKDRAWSLAFTSAFLSFAFFLACS